MFTDVHLLSHHFAGDSSFIRGVNCIKFGKDGGVIASDGRMAIIIGPSKALHDEAGHIESKDILLSKEDAKKILKVLGSIKMKLHDGKEWSQTKKAIKAFSIGIKGNKIKFEQKDTYMEFKPGAEKQPPVAETIQKVNPKNSEYKSVRVNIDYLIKILTTMRMMMEKDSAVKLYFAEKEPGKTAFGLEAVGKYGESIETFLMQLVDYNNAITVKEINDEKVN